MNNYIYIYIYIYTYTHIHIYIQYSGMLVPYRVCRSTPRYAPDVRLIGRLNSEPVSGWRGNTPPMTGDDR